MRVRCVHTKLHGTHVFVVAAQQDGASCFRRARDDQTAISLGSGHQTAVDADESHVAVHFYSDGQSKMVVKVLGCGPATRLSELLDAIEMYNRQKSVHITRTLRGLYLTRGLPESSPSSLWLLWHKKARLDDQDLKSQKTLEDCGYLSGRGLCLVQLYVREP